MLRPGIRRKTFIALAGLSVATCLAPTVLLFHQLDSMMRLEYLERYEALGSVVSGALQRMEIEAERNARAALHSLYWRERSDGLPSDAELGELAERLGISAFHVTDEQGVFIRSSVRAAIPQTKTLFDFCGDYRLLLSGETYVERTPIIPDFPGRVPQKFVMIANADRTRVLEASVHLNFLAETLERVVRGDSNVLSVGLFAPNGYELGSIQIPGGYRQGRNAMPENAAVGTRITRDVMQLGFGVPAAVQDCCECRTKKLLGDENDYHYILVLDVSRGALQRQLAAGRQVAVVVCIVVVLLSLVLARVLAKKMVRGIEDISSAVSTIVSTGDLDVRVPIPKDTDEVSRLAATLNHMLSYLKETQRRLVEGERARSMAQVALQVAHDIRSPLGSLESVCGQLAHLPKSHGELISMATRRIRAIAEDLLGRQRYQRHLDKRLGSPRPAVPIVADILLEKETQYAAGGWKFNLAIEEGAFGASVSADPEGLTRVLCNLIDNAAQSMQSGGAVEVSLHRTELGVGFTVRDHGCGISEEDLHRVTEEGASVGKTGGTGLGLSGSRRWLQGAGGHLTVSSRLGVGTEVTSHLPDATTPPWFATELRVRPQSTIAVLSGDKGVCDQLLRHGVGDRGVRAVSIDRACQFKTWVQASENRASTCLVEYELSGEPGAGLALVQELDIVQRTVLLVSREHLCDAEQTCEAIGARLIPRSCISLLPVVVDDEVHASDPRGNDPIGGRACA